MSRACHLHQKSFVPLQARNPEVRASTSGGFHYLLADLPLEAQQGGKYKQAAGKVGTSHCGGFTWRAVVVLLGGRVVGA